MACACDQSLTQFLPSADKINGEGSGGFGWFFFLFSFPFSYFSFLKEKSKEIWKDFTSLT